jgi:hypothetical protein
MLIHMCIVHIPVSGNMIERTLQLRKTKTPRMLTYVSTKTRVAL